MFDPARFSNCGLICAQTNPLKSSASMQAFEQSRFIQVLQKVTGVNVPSGTTAAKYLNRAKQLVKVSNQIYESKYIPENLKNGYSFVVDYLFPGDDHILNGMKNFNPVAFNNIQSGMSDVADKVRNGHLKIRDVKGLVNDIGKLANAAQDLFSGNNPLNPENNCFCDTPINYAKFVADWYFPKYTSLYVVQFKTNRDLDETHLHENSQGTFAFLCTRATRPSIKYDTVEINRYNTRMDVIIKSKFDEINLEFVDDDQNTVHDAYTALMNYYTPNSSFKGNITYDHLFAFSDPSLPNIPVGLTPGDISMAYNDTVSVKSDKQPFSNAVRSQQGETQDVFSSSVSEMNQRQSNTYSNKSSAISEIVIYHMFRFGNRLNKYTYYNPIIKDMKLSDLDSTGDTPSSASMSFSYANMTTDSYDLRDGSNSDWEMIRKLIASPLTPIDNATTINTEVELHYGGSSQPTVLGGNNTNEDKIRRMNLDPSTNKVKKSWKDKLENSIKKYLSNATNWIKDKITTPLISSIKSGLDAAKERVKNFEAQSIGTIKFPGGDTFEIQGVDGRNSVNTAMSNITTTTGIMPPTNMSTSSTLGELLKAHQPSDSKRGIF